MARQSDYSCCLQHAGRAPLGQMMGRAEGCGYYGYDNK